MFARCDRSTELGSTATCNAAAASAWKQLGVATAAPVISTHRDRNSNIVVNDVRLI